MKFLLPIDLKEKFKDIIFFHDISFDEIDYYLNYYKNIFHYNDFHYYIMKEQLYLAKVTEKICFNFIVTFCYLLYGFGYINLIFEESNDN